MSLAALQRDMIAWLRSGEPEDGAQLARQGGTHFGAGIYLNNHRASLMASLSAHYAQLRNWLGEEAFARAAAMHILNHAPTSWTLDAYGADFAETLAAMFPEDAELPDLARLEWALEMAFVAPDAATLGLADLGQIDWDHTMLRLARATALVPVTTNAEAILRALHEFAGQDHTDADENAAPNPPAVAILPAPGHVLVWRNAMLPCYRLLDDDEAPLLAAMAAGIGFAEICARLTERHGAEDGITRAGTLLARWAQGGICAVPDPS